VLEFKGVNGVARLTQKVKVIDRALKFGYLPVPLITKPAKLLTATAVNMVYFDKFRPIAPTFNASDNATTDHQKRPAAITPLPLRRVAGPLCPPLFKFL